MDKYYLTCNDQEIKLGEAINVNCFDSKTNIRVSIEADCLTEEYLEFLISLGQVYVKKADPIVNLNLTYYAKRVYNKYFGRFETFTYDNFLTEVADHKDLWYSPILKEVAMEISRYWDDDIEEYDEYYIIDRFSGTIELVDNDGDLPDDYIKFVSVFRTKEDAELALKIMQPIHWDLYGKECCK